jgi:hypothetical protein
MSLDFTHLHCAKEKRTVGPSLLGRQSDSLNNSLPLQIFTHVKQISPKETKYIMQ